MNQRLLAQARYEAALRADRKCVNVAAHDRDALTAERVHFAPAPECATLEW